MTTHDPVLDPVHIVPAAQAARRPSVVLASQSPRRRDLLDLVGIAHTVRPADVDEAVRGGETPATYVERLAREKAHAVARQIAAEAAAHATAATRATRAPARPHCTLVVAADTTVVVEGEILGKPADADEARAMLRRLSGRTHEVFTGMAVVRAADEASVAGDGAREAAGVERVAVTVRTLDDAAIDAYVATGEPMDKAGAYGIQGMGATIVARIHGDYFAVMGLSLQRLVTLFGALGVTYGFEDGLVADEG